MTKNNGILFIKGLAIIGVVVQHLHNRRFMPETLYWTDSVALLFCWCVLAFFAVSGWLHALSEQKHGRSFGDFLVSRIKRLLVPFFLLILLYAICFQIIQRMGVVEMRGVMSESFLGKVGASLWPINSQKSVGEQLYFLPLLFCISVLVCALAYIGKRRAVLFLTVVAFLVGICRYSHSLNTGFSLGVFVWGLFSYGAGYLIHYFPSTKRNLLLTFIAAGLVFLAAGPLGLLKLVAIVLLILLPWLEKFPASLLTKFGEASGTIYIYHTPFIIQPLLILVAARMHSWPLQVATALILSLCTVGLCCGFYYILRTTRLRGLLM